MDLYDGLLSELECKICMTYMGPPIRQCKTGHSICEPCMKKLSICPLCRGEFTMARNIALESLARKMMYPCINAKLGCKERFLLDDREKHEAACTYKGYKCAYPRCSWTGPLEDLKKHWMDKKGACRPYGETKICHTVVDKSDKTFVTLCEAYKQLFWFKVRNISGTLYWNVQFIGEEKDAKNYFFEVELIKPGDPVRKYIMSDFCSTENELETKSYVTTTSVAVDGYFNDKQTLIYYLRIQEVLKKKKSDMGKSVDDLLMHFEDTDLDPNPKEHKRDNTKVYRGKQFEKYRSKRGTSQHRNKDKAGAD